MHTTLEAANRSKRKRVDVLEFVDDRTKHQIDFENGIIRHVKILGERSVNGRVYPRSCRAAAVPLYEGTRVNVDHPPRVNPDQERPFSDWLGNLRDVGDEDDGLYGDLHLLLTNPRAQQVMEAAQKMSWLFGLSHNAVTFQAPHNGVVICTAIERVRSVDVVCKPATTRGLFESQGRAASAVVSRPAAAVGSVKAISNRFGYQLRSVMESDLPAARKRAMVKVLGQQFASDVREVNTLESQSRRGARVANRKPARSKWDGPAAAARLLQSHR